MNTTELIEIAELCDAQIHETVDVKGKRGPHFVVFLPEDLQQFAQRIEQPLQDRINRLVDKLNAKDTQIEQLREALSLLLDCAIYGYDMPEDHSYAIISRNALEQTK